MKKLLNILKYLLFLAIGVAVFYYIYKEVDIETLKTQVSNINWWWIVLSLIVGMLSHTCRAMRWNMLINTAGYQTNLFRTLCAVMSMYFTNLIIPRGGEIVRCTALSRTDNIPFARLLGTVVVERTVDILLMIVIAAILIVFQIDFLRGFFETPGHEGMLDKISFLFSPWFWIICGIVGIALIWALWHFRQKFAQIKFIQPIIGILTKFWEGIITITKLDHPWVFIFQSLFIYFAYFMMMLLTFYCFAPTHEMTFGAGLTTFIMGGLAMLAPVQGGIGPWHFMVYETLALYGVALEDGKIFALISHTTTNGFSLIVGAMCLVYLTIRGRKNKNEIPQA